MRPEYVSRVWSTKRRCPLAVIQKPHAATITATPVVRFTTSTENSLGFAGSIGVVTKLAPLSLLTASPQSVAT